MSAELKRLVDDAARRANWKRWGPYLSERQWGTVREDYSADGNAWEYFPHEHARSRAYRWGEDGLMGICDREARLCFSVALWNEQDAFLKERLFGLTNPQGNHGEDVKECYYYLDSTPTHSWMRSLYKYPQAKFPYEQLLDENGRRGADEPEYELIDTGVFNESRYFDIFFNYAKGGENDLWMEIEAWNRGPDPAPLHLVPTVWYRNVWDWGREGEGYGPRPALSWQDGRIRGHHRELGTWWWWVPEGGEPLFTENETNKKSTFGVRNTGKFTKDAFHRQIVDGEAACNPRQAGTKAGMHYHRLLRPGECWRVRMRLVSEATLAGDVHPLVGGHTAAVSRGTHSGARLSSSSEAPLSGGADSLVASHEAEGSPPVTTLEAQPLPVLEAHLTPTGHLSSAPEPKWKNSSVAARRAQAERSIKASAPHDPSALNISPLTDREQVLESSRLPASSSKHSEVAREQSEQRGHSVSAMHGRRRARAASARLHGECERGASGGLQGGGADWLDQGELVFQQRKAEADDYYLEVLPGVTPAEQAMARQACAGLFWSKQFYYYVVRQWAEGDPNAPPPPPHRADDRNGEWMHLYNRDVLLMPDKWEYPWYASWDSCFHCVAIAALDLQLAQEQLLLQLREWYMHPRGQIPAYEWNFSDVNPPVQAWAALRIYRGSPRGPEDRKFLERVFHKLLLNFTWWVNREEASGSNLFGGGFLGMDNVGLINRSNFPPELGTLLQTDGTAWMAFAALRLLQMALELARFDPVYEDMASKFFEHFVNINEALNTSSLWNEEDGFYYDVLVHPDGDTTVLKVRSMVGLLPLIATELLDESLLAQLPGFTKRMAWFLDNNAHLRGHIYTDGKQILLSLVPPDRQIRLLQRMLDPAEFLSDHGVRSLSKYHRDNPVEWQGHDLHYAPGDGCDRLFGGNSNWRGPIWFPVNYLLVEAVERLAVFYEDRLQVPFAGEPVTLAAAAGELHRRLVGLFLPDAEGRRPAHGSDRRYADDPHWKDLVLFYEFFNGDTGAGHGASHQTGWTALVLRLLEKVNRTEETPCTKI